MSPQAADAIGIALLSATQLVERFGSGDLSPVDAAEAALWTRDRLSAATSSFLRVAPEARTITLELTIDTEMAPVMQYFEIFLPRMLMSRHAAELLGCAFHITINEVVVL